MNPETNQTNGASREPWLQRHMLTVVAIAAVLAAVIAVVLLLMLRADKEPDISDNPTVASYQKQLPALAEKVKDDPKDVHAIKDYAIALYATGDVQGAKAQYEAEIKLNPTDSTAYNNLGNVYRDLRDYDKAVSSYKQAIKLNAKNANAYTNLANVYMYTLNKKDLGIATYEEAIKNLPKNQELPVLLGIAYEQTGDMPNAAKAFQQALDANPNNTAAAAGLKRVQ